MKKYIFPLILLLTFQTISSQEIEYAVFLIPDSLRQNANTVIRDNLLEVTIESANKQVIKRKRALTILNKHGDRNADLYQHYNNDTRIKKLSVKIYDALGNEIKKYPERKFTDVSAVSGGTMYSDAKVKYIDYTPTSYPYTIVFESEVENSSTGFLPKWYPMPGYSIAVQKSVYKVHNPQNIEIRKREIKLDEYDIKNLSEETTIAYQATNLPAEKYERSSLSFNEIMPSVSLALNDFALKGVQGKAANWHEFGKWMHDYLIQGRAVLDEATVANAKELVKDAKTDLEKAKIIYKYMQDRTRYISVQIGIGGWEPIAAKEVDKVGYGDCKGLTNYTKALLDAVGVKSHHVILYAKDRRDIDKDFTAMQGNHMILNIPNKGNDVWLECTSQIMPFGFLGDFTDDRNVLVVTPEGGVIKRTPAYKNETNLQTVKAAIVLDESGNATASVERISKGIQYDDKFKVARKSKEEQEKHYKSNVWDYNNNLELTSIQLKNDVQNIVFTEDVEVTIGQYASINQGEYLFRLNMFNKYSYIPKRYRKRTQPFKVSRGFLDKDEFTFTIPNGYAIGALPEKKELKTKFGTYSISVTKVGEDKLLYKKYFLLKDGVYPKEDYKKYRKFLKSVSKLENARIALKKK